MGRLEQCPERHCLSSCIGPKASQGFQDSDLVFLLDPRLSRLSIASIAHDRGFGDISGFNRAFRATYGISPSELRQGHPHSVSPDGRRPIRPG